MGDAIDARVIKEHLPLVRHIVFQVAVHFPRHVDREELARAGALGLVEAARRYDESRGVPFDRFAAQRIRGAILDAVRAADWAPRSVRNLARKMEQVEQRLATELGRVPSLREMADELNMTTDELNRLQDRMFRSVVLALEHDDYQVENYMKGLLRRLLEAGYHAGLPLAHWYPSLNRCVSLAVTEKRTRAEIDYLAMRPHRLRLEVDHDQPGLGAVRYADWNEPVAQR